jgi:hypothetical protein
MGIPGKRMSLVVIAAYEDTAPHSPRPQHAITMAAVLVAL